MEDFIISMGLPFLACLILVIVHVYFGMHVLAREIIFVDLALAQIAALGSVCGAMIGYSKDFAPFTNKGIALSFAVAGGLVFAISRPKKAKVAQEAIIGIAYAVALSLTILASVKLPHGADELRELLSGNILWVRPEAIIEIAILYSVVGLVHYVFRKPFLAISANAQLAEKKGYRVLWWDFLFYVTFGIVVTSSVAIVGVLLVFSFLVIPASIAMLLAKKLMSRLLIGWLLGTLVSGLGLYVSYHVELPTGPTVVVLLGLSLVVVSILRVFRVLERV